MVRHESNNADERRESAYQGQLRKVLTARRPSYIYHPSLLGLNGVLHQGEQTMVRLTMQIEDRELIAALHGEGHEHIKRFIRQLLLFENDPVLLEDCADMLLEELERRAAPKKR